MGYNRGMKHQTRAGITAVMALMLCSLTRYSASPLPRGFSPARAPERYGLPERKAAAGSIFDYMDGGGIVYIEHGFRELVHREFTDAGGRVITFDRFAMGSPGQALAALADPRIAPEGGAPLPLATRGKAYRFPPDYYIYMVQGESLIYLHVDDDRLAETLDQFAADILRSPEEKNK